MSPICRNCKYFAPKRSEILLEYRLGDARCTHPASTIVDKVTGFPKYKLAHDMRSTPECGSVGIRFEKETNVIVKWLRERPQYFLHLLAVLVAYIAVIALYFLSFDQ